MGDLLRRVLAYHARTKHPLHRPARPPVLAGQLVVEELLEAEVPEEAPEQRQRADAAVG